MKNDLIKYLEYEKSALNVNEEDFLRILDSIQDTRVASPSFAHKLRSPIFAWGLGFSGAVAALFMFILTDINNVETSNTDPSIVAYTNTNEVTRSVGIINQESLDQNKSKAIMAIDSIDSFANIDIE